MKTTTKTIMIVAASGAAISIFGADMAFAQDAASEAVQVAEQNAEGMKAIGKGLGVGLAAGLAVVGGGPGIGRIGGSAVEAISRQPEAAGTIVTNMILTAALVEGATLFAVVVGFLAMILI